MISLYGYAAPWKHATLLTTALRLMRTPARIVLAGQFWDDTAAATDLRLSAGGAIDVGVTELVLVPEYVGAAGRRSQPARVRSPVSWLALVRPRPN